MSQKSVEIVIGKLASDEDLRAAFQRDRVAAMRSLQLHGLELTPLEIASLRRIELDAFERLASTLDPRLRKVSLKAALGFGLAAVLLGAGFAAGEETHPAHDASGVHPPALAAALPLTAPAP